MSYLGKVSHYGVLDPMNPVFPGGWTITFPTAELPHIAFEVYHAAITGPPNSTFQVFLDDVFYDNVVRGDINSFDPSQAMFVTPDTTIYFYYSVSSGTPPRATIFFREPSPI